MEGEKEVVMEAKCCMLVRISTGDNEGEKCKVRWQIEAGRDGES